MPDTFDCPKCGASYARQQRQVGKAVICTCGQKFLVPPVDVPTPTVAPPTAAPKRSTAPAHRTPGRRPKAPPAASDASAEVLPFAEPEPIAPQPGVRWAEPVETQPAEPVMEAEVISTGNPHVDPLAPGNGLFGSASAYGTADLTAAHGPTLPSTAPPLRPLSKPPNTNPYASPTRQAASGSSGNPLLAPAIILLVLASLFLLLIVASLPGQILRIRAINTSTPEGVGALLGSIVTLIVWPLMNLGIAMGAVSMIRRTSYRSAYTAAILSVIPVCSPCFVLAIPFGIWSIVVLNRREVKRHFMDK